jgi:phytoene desaturase
MEGARFALEGFLMSRIVVIGAGVGGLSTAARLAVGGHQVTMFERADTPGGKLGIYERGGFRFDTGPSIVTLPYVYRDLFAAIGGDFDHDIALRRLDPIARYRFGDGTWFDASAHNETFFANVEAMRAGNADELRAFYKRAEEVWNATRVPFLERPLGGVRALARQSLNIRDLRAIAPWKSLRTLSKEYLSDSRLVDFIDRYATYTGSDPRRAPAALASIPFIERHYGGWYIDGGLRNLSDVLVRHCQRLGVTIRLSTEVSQIRVKRGRVLGVELASGMFEPADVVVANVEAAHVYGSMLSGDSSQGEDLSRSSLRAARRIANTPKSLSGFVICLAVNGTTPDLAHHTVLFPERYDEEFNDLFGPRKRFENSRPSKHPVVDPTIYISVPKDSAVAPPGCESWFVLVNAPVHVGQHDAGTGGVDWRAAGLADQYCDRVLEIMAARGVDVRDRVRFREIRTPADLEERTGSMGGAIYGTSSNGPMAAFLRPENETKVGGLFLVGGSSHPGGGLPLVTLSAQIVSERIGLA